MCMQPINPPISTSNKLLIKFKTPRADTQCSLYFDDIHSYPLTSISIFKMPFCTTPPSQHIIPGTRLSKEQTERTKSNKAHHKGFTWRQVHLEEDPIALDPCKTIGSWSGSRSARQVYGKRLNKENWNTLCGESMRSQHYWGWDKYFSRSPVFLDSLTIRWVGKVYRKLHVHLRKNPWKRARPWELRTKTFKAVNLAN